jgi:Flp pilus assembly protein protease CpaA
MDALPWLPRIFVSWLCLLWLGGCVFHDLCSRTVPLRLTLPVLGLAAAWRLALGGWVLVLLAVGLIIISDLPRRAWRIAAGILAGTLAGFVCGSWQCAAVILAILAEWLLWEFGLTGGADAKIVLALLLLSGDAGILLWITLAGGLQGLAGLLAKRKTIPYTLAIFAGTLVWLIF